MTKLQQAILASLPRVDADGTGEYLTASGLRLQADAHPLVEQASLASIRANLGTLHREGFVVRYARLLHRRPRANSYAVVTTGLAGDQAA